MFNFLNTRSPFTFKKSVKNWSFILSSNPVDYVKSCPITDLRLLIKVNQTINNLNQILKFSVRGVFSPSGGFLISTDNTM